jgi:signal transduction histidine kinase/HAMP domain-containing protein
VSSKQGATASEPPRRLFLSLGVRVAIPVVLLVVTVAVGVYLGLVQQSRLTLLSSKELAADMVVKLTSVSAMPAVVFGDQQEIQRAVENLARNPDVSDVELWGSDSSGLGGNEGLLAEFHRSGPRRLGRPSENKSQRSRDAESIRVIEPVVNLEGTRVAALVVRFSTAREAAALAQLSRQISSVSVATALCLALAILLAVHRVVVRPVKRLEDAAARLARGEQHQFDRGRARVGDEVATLAEKFAEMAEAVRDREVRLGVRNAELKLILDSVDQGFLTARPDGTLFPERSAIVEKWTGPLGPDATVWTLAGLIDPAAKGWMEASWGQVSEDLLPLRVAIDQLPTRLQRDGQQFSLQYHPVLVDERLQRMVIVITDVTAEVERQRALAEQHEFAALVDQFVRDRRAFRAFWSEASRLVASILEPTPPAPEVLRRYVHTLKGNARFFGLSRVSRFCHDLETAMTERGDFTLTSRERTGLHEIWQSLSQRIEPLMQGATVFIEVSQDEYQRLLDAVSARQPFEQLEQLVRGLRRESVATRLERAKTILESTSRKLGKTPPRVEISYDELRVPPGPWAPFWSVLSHVLNNAVDHGVESDDERRSAGKSVPATVGLSVRLRDGEVIIEVRDDGRGIDWDRVRSLAAERGLPSKSQADLEQALLSDSFSLRHEVSEVSGRGVGLAAVKSVVTAMGGRIELESKLHAGAAWRFRFSLATLGDSGPEYDAAPAPTPTNAAPRALPNLAEERARPTREA